MSITIPSDFPSKPSAKQPKFDIPAPASEMHEKGSGYAKVEGDNTSHKIKVGADDLGSLTIGGSTAEVTRKGPQGGGKFEYSEEKEVVLTSGFHKASWSFDNIDYKPASGNVAKFEALLDDKQVELMDLKGVQFLPVEESPGGFDTGESEAKSYIETGEGGNHPFDIRAGVLFGDSENPNKNLEGSFIEGAGTFVPASMTSDSDGFKKFLVKTTSATPNINIEVNGIEANGLQALPAVFKDTFHITVYYTPKESGCHDNEPKVKLTVGGRVVNVFQKFLKAVKMEGCGLLESPPNADTPYIGELKWTTGALSATAQAYKAPLGVANRVLTPLSSCAASSAQFKAGASVKVCDANIAALLGNDTWTVDDIGGGIAKNELDLYWGEDDPSPNSLSIPAGLSQGIDKQGIRVELVSP